MEPEGSLLAKSIIKMYAYRRAETAQSTKQLGYGWGDQGDGIEFPLWATDFFFSLLS
jgi:hypothetical protein